MKKICNKIVLETLAEIADPVVSINSNRVCSRLLA